MIQRWCMNTLPPKIIVIAGPTATGKTSLAIKLAKKYSGEVISADSRQVYQGLDIGSAKVTTEEMNDIPHHLLDVANPDEVFSVSDFKHLGHKAITDILQRGNIPIICGGTGFYIDSLIYNHHLPEVPANYELREQLEKYSCEELYTQLQEKDPRRADEIDINNKIRIIRALEIYEALGYIPENEVSYESEYDVLYLVLNRERESHFQGIDQRITQRLKQGMLEEVKDLHNSGISWERLEAFGLEYRYLAQHLQGKLSLDEAIKVLSSETKKFVKRQYTWFKKNPHVLWFDPVTQKNEILASIDEFLNK